MRTQPAFGSVRQTLKHASCAGQSCAPSSADAASIAEHVRGVATERLEQSGRAEVGIGAGLENRRLADCKKNITGAPRSVFLYTPPKPSKILPYSQKSRRLFLGPDSYLAQRQKCLHMPRRGPLRAVVTRLKRVAFDLLSKK